MGVLRIFPAKLGAKVKLLRLLKISTRYESKNYARIEEKNILGIIMYIKKWQPFQNLKKYIVIALLSYPLIANAQVLIKESFNDNLNEWEIFNDQISSTNIENKQYCIENRTTNPTVITKIFKLTGKEDFEVETTTRYKYGQNANYYGLYLGVSSIDNGYFFGISKTKNKYVIYKML